MKRLIDCVLSVTGLVLLSPVLAVVALLIFYQMGSPILFRQMRPGIQGKPFYMIKFRTMRDAFDEKGNSLPDSARLTKLGRFLRASSLDELPELWNVVKGEMSIVGPRPLLMEYLPYFTPEERLRMTVKPGVTGYAQIKGRNCTPWNERLAADIYYVRNHSIRFDIKIIFRTMTKVLQRSGVAVDPSAIMQDLNVERAQYINVRRLTSNEIKMFGKLLQSTLCHEFFAGTIVLGIKFPEFLQDILAPRSEMFGIFRNDKLVGGYQAIEKQNCLHLNYFTVLGDERGWGTADLLMCDLKRRAGDRELSLHVDSRNTKALYFYKKQGFTEVERVEYLVANTRGSTPLSTFSILDPDQFDTYGFSYLNISDTQVGVIDQKYLILDAEASPEAVSACLDIQGNFEVRGPAQLFESCRAYGENPSFYVIKMFWNNQENEKSSFPSPLTNAHSGISK